MIDNLKIKQIKHYMDIQRVREQANAFAAPNTGGFEVGDHIVIQEKVDGANASIRYDAETGKMAVFSRNQELFDDRALKGFWSYVQTLPVEKFLDAENYVVFGEWLIPHAVEYKPEAYGKWYIYDLYNVEKRKYMPQTVVQEFCRKHGLFYVKTLYKGPFISWEHCRSFAGQSEIAREKGEGVVVKNQTKLNCESKECPFVVKIVCDDFAEVRKKRKPACDSQKREALVQAQAIVEQIVTPRRIEKEWMKMRDEGLVPDMEVKPNISILAKNLPRRVYQDCVKEEKMMVTACEEYFGKLCQKQVIKFLYESENPCELEAEKENG